MPDPSIEPLKLPASGETSIFDPSGRAFLAIMENENIERLHQRFPVWVIQRTGILTSLIRTLKGTPRCASGYDARRVNLLRAIHRDARPLWLWHAENLAIELTPEVWRPSPGGHWLVPEAVDIERLCKLGGTGEWFLYSAPQPVRDWPRLDWDREPRRATDFLHEHDIQIIVYPFYDDDPWWIALG